MLYIIAILIPPLATLLVGKFLATFVCLVLFLLTPALVILWPIAALIAILTVHGAKTQRTIKKEIRSLRQE